jgi:hypothetical protein
MIQTNTLEMQLCEIQVLVLRRGRRVGAFVLLVIVERKLHSVSYFEFLTEKTGCSAMASTLSCFFQESVLHISKPVG